jgi:catechol 2,3-dioxygenase-like lactoylglutathione lyase family enzyme
MTVAGLDHVNISGTRAQLESCRAFYVDVIGLTDGFRPPFRSRGFWLYAGDEPIIHLTERARDTSGAGAFDHVAFRCSGFDEMRATLDARGIDYTVDEVPGEGRAQLFLTDPAGVAVELNFPAR